MILIRGLGLLGVVTSLAMRKTDGFEYHRLHLLFREYVASDIIVTDIYRDSLMRSINLLPRKNNGL